MNHGTVQNALTNLRKRGLVEYTGEVEPHTKAKEVRLTNEGAPSWVSGKYIGTVTP